MNLPQHVRKLGGHLATWLESLVYMDGVGDVRCIGLVAGIEFTRDGAPDPDRARRVGEAVENRGVLFRIINNTLAISPPYICTAADIDQMIEVMAQSIAAEGGDLTVKCKFRYSVHLSRFCDFICLLFSKKGDLSQPSLECAAAT